MTPSTGQAAALEKDGRPQTGSVFGGHALDFENETGFVHKIRVRGFEVSRVRGSMFIVFSVWCVAFGFELFGALRSQLVLTFYI